MINIFRRIDFVEFMFSHLFARALTLQILDSYDDDEFNIIDIAMRDSYPSTGMIFKRSYEFTLYLLLYLTSSSVESLSQSNLLSTSTIQV